MKNGERCMKYCVNRSECNILHRIQWNSKHFNNNTLKFYRKKETHFECFSKTEEAKMMENDFCLFLNTKHA